MEASAQPVTAKGAVTTAEPTRLEQAFARRVAESAATIPAGSAELVVEGLPDGPVQVVVARALARALAEHPRANGAWRDGRFEHYGRVNVAVVLRTDEGVVAPTLFDADRRGVEELASDLEELAGAAQEGRLTSPQLSGATTTLWTASGVDRLAAPVAPGQAVALAAAFREDRVTLTLAFDQRVLPPRDGGDLLARVGAHLQGGEAVYA